MKQTIVDSDILTRLSGRYIIQLNSDDHIRLDRISESRVSFFIEKRVSLIACEGTKVMLIDPYGGVMTYGIDEFVEFFNNYLGSSKGKRYHRLMTTEEIKVLFDFISKRQYV